MDMARERGWKGKFRRRGRVIRPGANRIDGKCPLTPLEVSLKNCLASLKIFKPVNLVKLIFVTSLCRWE